MKAAPIQIKVTLRTTIPQSRSANADNLRQQLMDTIKAYDMLPEEQQVFGRMFRGYVKTGYNAETIQVR